MMAPAPSDLGGAAEAAHVAGLSPLKHRHDAMPRPQHLGATAPGMAAAVDAAGLSPPHKNEAPDTVGAVDRGGDQGTTNTEDSARPAPTGQAPDGKAVATLRARLALAGWQLSGDDGNVGGPFVASRWDRSRELVSLADVEAFARQVGAPS